MTELQKQIKKTLAEVNQISKVRKHLLKLEERLVRAHVSQNKLLKVLEDKYEDLDELEKLSLKSLFHKVLGSKEEQMEKERQEYLQASLKYDEHKKTIELLEYEKKVLVEKLDKMNEKGNRQEELERMLKQREREIIRSNKRAGTQLLAWQEQIDAHQTMIVEVREALELGYRATDILEEIMTSLRKARNWGRWDMGKRKSYQASQFKHSSIDKAREKAYQAQQVLQRFEDELHDVYGNVVGLNLEIEFDSFSRFIDVFFDNLISDWVIQQKIKNALSNVSAVSDRLRRLVEGLKKEEENSQKTIAKLRRQRKKILTS